MNQVHDLINFFNNTLKYSTRDWEDFKTSLPTIEAELLTLELEGSFNKVDSVSNELLKTDPKDPNFVRIKKRLLDKLLHRVGCSDYSTHKFTLYQKAYVNDQKLFAVFNILKAHGRANLCFSIARKLYRRSRLYHFTEIRLVTSRYLYRHYSEVSPNKIKTEEYLNEMKTAVHLISAESELDIDKSYVLNQLKSNHHFDQDFYENLYQRIKSKAKYIGIESLRFHRLYFNSLIIIERARNNHDAAIKLAKEGLDYLDKLEFNHTSAKAGFLTFLSRGYIDTGQLHKAKETIELCLDLQAKHSRNWFNIKRTQLDIELSLKNFEEAHKIHLNLNHLRKNKSLDFLAHEYMLKTELYLSFLAFSNIYTPSKKFNRLQINNKIDYLRKRENEIRLDVELLDLLISTALRNKSRLNQIKIKVDPITSKKIHKNNPNFRSLCLINMLMLVTECNFHPEAVKRKTYRLAAKLQAIPFDQTKISIDHEIISYEYLWQVVMKNLEENHEKKMKSLSKN